MAMEQFSAHDWRAIYRSVDFEIGVMDADDEDRPHLEGLRDRVAEEMAEAIIRERSQRASSPHKWWRVEGKTSGPAEAPDPADPGEAHNRIETHPAEPAVVDTTEHKPPIYGGEGYGE